MFEAVAGGCGATAFVWAQHHGAVRRVAGGDGPARDAWLPRLCDGSTLAGIGFAHLRRPGPAAVRAERAPGGWRITGEAPWITGWGLIDALVVMARASDGSVVTAVVDRPAGHAALHPGEPQALAVMGATGTVVLGLDVLEVADRDVVGVQTEEAWRRRDRAGSALPPAAPLGIADRAIRLLRERASDPGVTSAASALAVELDERRAATDKIAAAIAGSMVDDRPIDDMVLTGATERDRGLDLARRAHRRARGGERRRCDVARSSRTAAESRGDVLLDPGPDRRSAGDLARPRRAFSLNGFPSLGPRVASELQLSAHPCR